jgi:nucleoside-diphosphate-sugar epimerase
MHLCKSLLDDNYEVLGIDNINDYYDPKLKHARLDQLTPYKNYKCEVLNLGNHRSEQLMDVVHLIEENLGKKAEREFLPMQPGDVKESFAEIQKSEEKLGFMPTTNIEVGIQKFVEWYKQHCSES